MRELEPFFNTEEARSYIEDHDNYKHLLCLLEALEMHKGFLQSLGFNEQHKVTSLKWGEVIFENDAITIRFFIWYDHKNPELEKVDVFVTIDGNKVKHSLNSFTERVQLGKYDKFKVGPTIDQSKNAEVDASLF